MTDEDRLSAVEKDIIWLKMWVEVLVKAHYGVNTLDEIPPLHQQIKKMPKLEEPSTWVA